MMGLFGTLGKAVGIGGFKKAGGAMGIPGMGGGRMRAVGSMDPAAKDRMRAALTAGRNDGSIKGPMGMLKFMGGYRDTPPPVASPAAPVPPGMEAMGQAPPPQMAQMGMAPGGGAPASVLQGAMQQMSRPAPAGPSPLQAGIQQMIGPQESDPYEAWKAGGRQGARPAGY